MLTEKLPDVELIAEDLGDLRPEVLTLKEHYHLKGMKVLEFVLDTSGKYAVDSFSDEENMIVYTGTHDNSTLMEWYQELSVPSRRKIRRFMKRQGIKTVLYRTGFWNIPGEAKQSTQLFLFLIFLEWERSTTEHSGYRRKSKLGMEDAGRG